MVRCRGYGAELKFTDRILANTTRLRGVIAVAMVKRIESTVVDRGFWPQTECIVKVFGRGEADRGCRVGLGKRD